MKVVLGEKLGGGGFGDVWEVEDELGRSVAVKIIREAGIPVADALAHAKALAKTSHPNVVKVHSIERVEDPVSGDEVDAVIMELIEGETLESRLALTPLDRTEVQRFGVELIDGVDHIHEQGLAHGDLHAENVMVADDRILIIDILYLGSLSLLSTRSVKVRLAQDLLGLRLLLQQILADSELDPAEAHSTNCSGHQRRWRRYVRRSSRCPIPTRLATPSTSWITPTAGSSTRDLLTAKPMPSPSRIRHQWR